MGNSCRCALMPMISCHYGLLSCSTDSFWSNGHPTSQNLALTVFFWLYLALKQRSRVMGGRELFSVSMVLFSTGFLLIQVPIFRLFGHGHEYNEIFKNSVYKDLKARTFYSSIKKTYSSPFRFYSISAISEASPLWVKIINLSLMY